MKEWKSSVSRMANGCTLKNFYPVALYSMDQLIFRLDSFMITKKRKRKLKKKEQSRKRKRKKTKKKKKKNKKKKKKK